MTKEQNIRRDLIWRVNFVYFFIAIFVAAIIAQIIKLQIFEGEKWKKEAEKINLVEREIEANRGDILSSDKKLLATSVPYYEIRWDSKSDGLTRELLNDKLDSLALRLSQLFRDKSKRQYKNLLLKAIKKGNRYTLIHRNATFVELKELKKFPIFRLGKFKGGLITIQSNKRIKPFGDLASRSIGYLAKNNRNKYVGIVGLERAFENILRGKTGLALMQRLSGGVYMPINNGTQIEPEDGKDIVTTIDVKMQDIVNNALMKQLEHNEAHHGCAILMETATGEIKGIANLERTKSGKYKELYNYAIGESSEPGSTFKLASLIVAFEDGVIDLNDSIDTENGIIRYYGQKMKDSHSGLGKITVKRAFEESSNVGISKIIFNNYKNNPERFVTRLYEMGLNKKTGIKILGESDPLIKFPGDPSWSGVTLPWMSIGYEIKLTPLQVLNFYNAVANNGVMVQPHFLKQVFSHGKLLETVEPKITNPAICSKSTLKKVHEMLTGVVEEGTARNIKSPNFKIAGKTGTAQVAMRNRGYVNKEGKKSYQASFVGYFPADKPKYSCIVVINSPSKKKIYGSQLAAPVFKEIAEKVYATSLDIVDYSHINNPEPPYSRNANTDDLVNTLKYLSINYKVKTSKELAATKKTDKAVLLQNIAYTSNYNLIPDLKGMCAKDAIYILENRGLQVKIKGAGSVIFQSIPAGSRFNKGDLIIIELG